MISNPQNLNDDKVKFLADKYVSEGFHILDKLPFDLGNYQPDIIATKDDISLVIEVRTSLSRVSVDSLQAIAEEVSTHPGWRFLLVTLEDIEAKPLPGTSENLPSWQELNYRFVQAHRLIKNQEIEPAFLFMWSILEGALRKRAVDVSIPVERFPVLGLLKHMYSLGELSISQFDFVKACLQIRNSLAHGYIEKLNLQVLLQFENLVSQLLAEWTTDTSISQKIAKMMEPAKKDYQIYLEIVTSELEKTEKKDEILANIKKRCQQEGLTNSFNELQHLADESDPVVEPAPQSPDFDFINHSFIGMWSDRQNLTDSTAWVRGIRENEWSKLHD
ncbi:MAG: hypothetical protein KME59_26005 [Trichormus sp. ATA11-4-KO1]|jgi:hypothetical protein|nr:hypothetical protein [Trichormus sp. ATA11-4-KO1]